MLVWIPFLLMANLCFADLTEVNIENPYYSGKIFQFPMPNPTSVTSGEGGAGMNMIPIGIQMTRKPNIEQPNGFTTSWTFEQTKIYEKITNKFVPITPRTIYTIPGAVSKVAGGDSGTSLIEDNAGANFLRTFNNAPYNAEEYRFGKYRLRVRINVNSTGFADQMEMEFIISPIGIRDANVDGGTFPESGGGITPGDLNDQNVNQGNWWTDLFDSMFIPEQENLDTLQDLLVDIGHWGPFGFLAAIESLLNSHSGGAEMELQFTLPSTYLLPAGWTVNLEPYETYIIIGRTIMAMGLWWYFIWNIWGKLIKKMAIGG